MQRLDSHFALGRAAAQRPLPFAALGEAAQRDPFVAISDTPHSSERSDAQLRTERRRRSTGGSTERAVRIESSDSLRSRYNFRVPLRIQNRRCWLQAAVGSHF